MTYSRIGRSGPLGRIDRPGKHRLSFRKQTSPAVKNLNGLRRRVDLRLPGSWPAANVGNESLDIVIIQLARAGVGHDDQSAPVGIDAVVDGSKDFAIGPVAQLRRGAGWRI
jgi:hypothetical protein